MKLLKPIIVSIVTIAILAWLMPNISYGSNWITLIIAALVLTLLNKIAKPILKILFLPINIVTLGLFSTVINVLILWLATYFVPGFVIVPVVIMGFHLNQFFTFLLMSALISMTQSIISFVL